MCHESGIHTNFMIKDRRSYQILSPESIGADQPEFLFGKHSGRNAITSILKMNGLNVSDEISVRILDNINNLSESRMSSVTTNDIIIIYTDLI